MQHPSAAIPPAAIVTAARQAADAALMAGAPAVQIAVSERGRIIYSAAFGHVIINALPAPTGADAHLIALTVAGAALATP